MLVTIVGQTCSGQAFAQFVLDLERKINDCNQVAEDDERYDEKKKKDSLKQAILGCPDLVSLEMFENLHRQKYGKPMEYKRYRTMVLDMCGSLDIAKEASRGGNTKRLSHHTETSGYEALLHETDDNDSSANL